MGLVESVETLASDSSSSFSTELCSRTLNLLALQPWRCSLLPLTASFKPSSLDCLSSVVPFNEMRLMRVRYNTSNPSADPKRVWHHVQHVPSRFVGNKFSFLYIPLLYSYILFSSFPSSSCASFVNSWKTTTRGNRLTEEEISHTSFVKFFLLL